MYMYIHTHICTSISPLMNFYVAFEKKKVEGSMLRVRICTHIFMYLYIPMYISIHMYAHMYISIHIYTHQKQVDGSMLSDDSALAAAMAQA